MSFDLFHLHIKAQREAPWICFVLVSFPASIFDLLLCFSLKYFLQLLSAGIFLTHEASGRRRRLRRTSPLLSPSRSSGPDRRFVCGSAENRADLLPGSRTAAESKAGTSQTSQTCSWVLEVQRSRTQTAGQSQDPVPRPQTQAGKKTNEAQSFCSGRTEAGPTSLAAHG